MPHLNKHADEAVTGASITRPTTQLQILLMLDQQKYARRVSVRFTRAAAGQPRRRGRVIKEQRIGIFPSDFLESVSVFTCCSSALLSCQGTSEKGKRLQSSFFFSTSRLASLSSDIDAVFVKLNFDGCAIRSSEDRIVEAVLSRGVDGDEEEVSVVRLSRARTGHRRIEYCPINPSARPTYLRRNGCSGKGKGEDNLCSGVELHAESSCRSEIAVIGAQDAAGSAWESDITLVSSDGLILVEDLEVKGQVAVIRELRIRYTLYWSAQSCMVRRGAGVAPS